MDEYEHDCRGFRVLVGLTHEETEEFELLDRKIDTLRAAEQMLYEAGNSPMTADVKRWATLRQAPREDDGHAEVGKTIAARTASLSCNSG